MTGWQIESVIGTQCYALPPGYSLAAGAHVRVHSGPSALNNPPSDLRWTTGYIWNNDGDEARLFDSASRLVDSWAYWRFTWGRYVLQWVQTTREPSR